MSAVVGCDLSSKAIDLVKLEEDSNRAEWVRCELHGKTAWERTLNIRTHRSNARISIAGTWPAWWEDVYLVAIEAPYGRGQAGTNAILNRVVGAIAASLPAALRAPERCWLVRPDEWKAGLGLKAKPTAREVCALAVCDSNSTDVGSGLLQWDQNARDAYCIAMWARETNAKGVAA